MSLATPAKFSISNWTVGTAGDSTTAPTLLESFGLSTKNLNPQIPSLQAQLPGAAAAASNSSSGGGGEGTGSSGAEASGSYTFSQLEQLWTSAGGNPQYRAIAAAIAMAESSGNPLATDHDSNGTVDRGLWQINSTHGSLSTYNVMQNARAAVQISNNGTNWSPWTTFTTGAYLKFMPTSANNAGSAPTATGA